MKKFLVCSLDDEHYTQACYDFCNSLEEAKEQCIKNVVEVMDVKREAALECMEFKQEEDTEFPTWRYDYSDEDNFFVNQIIEIDVNENDYLCVWYHAYNGVDFKIEHIGTEKECAIKRAFLSTEAYVERGIDIEIYISNTVVDTGEEWEVWELVINYNEQEEINHD